MMGKKKVLLFLTVVALFLSVCVVSFTAFAAETSMVDREYTAVNTVTEIGVSVTVLPPAEAVWTITGALAGTNTCSIPRAVHINSGSYSGYEFLRADCTLVTNSGQSFDNTVYAVQYDDGTGNWKHWLSSTGDITSVGTFEDNVGAWHVTGLLGVPFSGSSEYFHHSYVPDPNVSPVTTLEDLTIIETTQTGTLSGYAQGEISITASSLLLPGFPEGMWLASSTNTNGVTGNVYGYIDRSNAPAIVRGYGMGVDPQLGTRVWEKPGGLPVVGQHVTTTIEHFLPMTNSTKVDSVYTSISTTTEPGVQVTIDPPSVSTFSFLNSPGDTATCSIPRTVWIESGTYAGYGYFSGECIRTLANGITTTTQVHGVQLRDSSGIIHSWGMHSGNAVSVMNDSTNNMISLRGEPWFGTEEFVQTSYVPDPDIPSSTMTLDLNIYQSTQTGTLSGYAQGQIVTDSTTLIPNGFQDGMWLGNYTTSEGETGQSYGYLDISHGPNFSRGYGMANGPLLGAIDFVNSGGIGPVGKQETSKIQHVIKRKNTTHVDRVVNSVVTEIESGVRVTVFGSSTETFSFVGAPGDTANCLTSRSVYIGSGTYAGYHYTSGECTRYFADGTQIKVKSHQVIQRNGAEYLHGWAITSGEGSGVALDSTGYPIRLREKLFFGTEEVVQTSFVPDPDILPVVSTVDLQINRVNETGTLSGYAQGEITIDTTTIFVPGSPDGMWLSNIFSTDGETGKGYGVIDRSDAPNLIRGYGVGTGDLFGTREWIDGSETISAGQRRSSTIEHVILPTNATFVDRVYDSVNTLTETGVSVTVLPPAVTTWEVTGVVPGTSTCTIPRTVRIDDGTYAGYMFLEGECVFAADDGQSYDHVIHVVQYEDGPGNFQHWISSTGDIISVGEGLNGQATTYAISLKGKPVSGTSEHTQISYIQDPNVAPVTTVEDLTIIQTTQAGTLSGYTQGEISITASSLLLPGFPEGMWLASSTGANGETGNVYGYIDRSNAPAIVRGYGMGTEPLLGTREWVKVGGLPVVGQHVTTIIEHAIHSVAQAETGSDVKVNVVSEDPGGEPIPADITFENVTSAGEVTITEIPTPAPPANFSILGGQSFDISTDAGFTGIIEVCLGYDEDNLLPEMPENNLRLLHFAAPAWEDITSVGSIDNPNPDTKNNVICGLSTSLSPFAVGVQENSQTSIPAVEQSTGVPVMNGIWLLFAVLGGAGVIVRRGKNLSN